MKKLFLLALTLASLGACKKDSENTPSKMELLTAKSWRITAYTSTTTVTGSTPSTTTSDRYVLFPVCAKDDFTKFNTDKTMVQDQGPSQCSPSGAQKAIYTWDFNSDQSKLLIGSVGSSSIDASDIAELSATTLRLRDTDTSTPGTTIVEEVTFTAF